MASSRHLKGTVLSRVRDLLKSGVLKEKPVWYDVVATYPPVVEADFDRPPEQGCVRQIVFQEDVFRRFVDKCMEFIEKGSNETEAFDQTVTLFKGEVKPKQIRTTVFRPTKPRDDSKTIHDFMNLQNNKAAKDD